MVMIANLQYGWTLFVHPLHETFHWHRSAIQVAFTLFIMAETWLLPFEGWVVDRFGPRRVVFAGGLLVAASWAVNSIAQSLAVLYLGSLLGGIGAGAVFGTCIANALKWYPERRGLAVGLTVAGYGMGSAFTIVPLQHTIATAGYQAAFLWFGLAQGIVVCIASLLLASPVGEPGENGAVTPAAAASPVRELAPLQVLRAPVFWVMYVMFILVASGGLVFTAQLGPIAHDFEVAKVPVSLLGITLPALTFALALDRVTNGLTRPFCGWLSDHLGREMTMFLAFSLEAAGIWALATWGRDPVAFVILGGLVFFAWGEVSSLFPAACGDCFGTRYATANVGMMYTAKGVSALLVPLASLLVSADGGHWQIVFLVAASMNALAAIMALTMLRPLIRKAQLQP